MANKLSGKNLKHLKNWALSVCLTVSSLALGSPLASLETLKSHSRLSLTLDEGTKTEWKNSLTGFELLLRGASLTDLGAPLGEEGAWLKQYQAVRDSRLKDLQILETSQGVIFRGKWSFPLGKEALAQPEMITFDYWDKHKRSWVLDFWVKPGMTLSEAHQREVIQNRIDTARRRDMAASGRVKRRTEKARAKADAEDAQQFCKTSLSEERDVILQLQPWHDAFDLTHWTPNRAPDENFTFHEPKGQAQDAQYVRLAMRLFSQQNHGLAIRALDFLEKEHPQSIYRTEMKLLRASALFKLGVLEQSDQLLRELVEGPKSSGVGLQASLYLLSKQWKTGNYLAALESFMWLASNHPEYEHAWIFHMGAAEAARALKQTDRAADEYQWVAKYAPERKQQVEGALRMGDLYLERFQYDQGLAAYAQGIRHFQKEAERFPAVFINRAEALYGLEQYEQAKGAFTEFLAKYPGHPAGWRATFRLAEIEARRSEGSRMAPEARKWYLATVNQFPYGPGATLARLQLMSCGDRAGLHAESAKRFFAEEAERFNGAGEISMERYRDYKALARVRTLMSLKQPEDAVLAGLEELKHIGGTETRKWIGGLLAINFRKSILQKLDEAKPLDALTFYERHEGVIPKSDIHVDSDYLLRLSIAASDLNFGKKASEIATDFEHAQKLQDGASRQLASDLKDLPDDPDTLEKLDKRHYAQARALWTEKGLSGEEKIRKELESMGTQSRFSFEKEVLLAVIDAGAKRYKSAFKHSAKAELLGTKSREVRAWSASLAAQAGDLLAALDAYRGLDQEPSGTSPTFETTQALGVPGEPSAEERVHLIGDILEKLGHWGEAAAHYAAATSKQKGGLHVRYVYAQALLRTGESTNRKRALEVLEKVVSESVQGSNEKDKFWKELANQALANTKLEESAKEGARQ